jgi:4-diphosphocytidyl-2-C-methyl-D-erythritol kinase
LNQVGLEQIARPLGADVPFFVRDYCAAIATGIGDRLQKVEPLEGFWLLLVNPGFCLATKWVYENFPLTSCSNPYILARGRIVDSDYTAVPPELFTELGNDLEAVTIKRYPIIGDIKKELKKAGAAAALMSGSGPAVFGLFAGMEEAQRGFVQFAREYGNNVFLVRPYIP